jgi:uracil-DNA glycosylase family 4
MYQTGMGFVPDELIPGATVFVLGQNPGEDEEKQGKPFVGKTGQVMMSTYFPAAGLVRGENVSIGNVLRCRWQGTNNLPTGKTLYQAIIHCTKSYLSIPSSTRLIVAQGALALKAVAPTKSYSIQDWRGFLIPGGYDASHNRDTREGQESEGQQIRETLLYRDSTGS